MKKTLALLLALCVLLSCASAVAYQNGESIGDMTVVNCEEWVTLRAWASTQATSLLHVPLGETVHDCTQYDSRFTFCEYDGSYGYILSKYLQANDETEPQGGLQTQTINPMRVVNCDVSVTLRAMPDTSANAVMQVPLGAIVNNCIQQDEDFIYCEYDSRCGFILADYLTNDLASEQESASGTFGGLPVDYYLGMMRVVNCQTSVTLRAEPTTGAKALKQVPLNAVVTGCWVVAENGFVSCLYENTRGYILGDYLMVVTAEELTSRAPINYSEIILSDRVILETDVNGISLAACRVYEGEGERERLKLGAYNEKLQNVWSLSTATTYSTELDLTDVFMAGTAEKPLLMVYNRQIGLMCLDIPTGEILWTLKSDEVSLGASLTHAVAENGNMYITGYYGPDPVAITADGEVLWQSHVENEDVFWPYQIELQTNAIVVRYDSYSQSNEYGFYVVFFDYNGTPLWVTVGYE